MWETTLRSAGIGGLTVESAVQITDGFRMQVRDYLGTAVSAIPFAVAKEAPMNIDASCMTMDNGKHMLIAWRKPLLRSTLWRWRSKVF